MANKRYVKQNADGGWDVLKEGHSRATAHADTERKAVARARTMARNEGGGEIRIMNRVGKVIGSDTVTRRRASRTSSRSS